MSTLRNVYLVISNVRLNKNLVDPLSLCFTSRKKAEDYVNGLKDLGYSASVKRFTCL